MKCSRNIPPEASAATAPRQRRAFTLIELLVVIAIIGLIAAITLPSVTKLFSTGADVQAYNIMSALLSGARAYAIQNATYAGVHVQLVTNTALPLDMQGDCYVCVVAYDQNTHLFVPAEGFTPRKIPGEMAFGEISDKFVDPNPAGDYNQVAFTAVGINDFMTFTVVFSPSGAVTRNVPGNNIVFDSNQPLFNPATDPNQRLWDPNIANHGTTGEAGATALTMFNAGELIYLPEPNRADYMNKNGQFLPINVYTGQMFPRR